MKKYLSIILAVLFISVGFRDILTIIDFYSNREFIIDNYCINKNKPEVMCSGICYLSNQLEDNSEDQESTLPIHYSAKLFKLQILDISQFVINNSNTDAFQNELVRAKNKFYHFDYLSENFHPPQVVVST